MDSRGCIILRVYGFINDRLHEAFAEGRQSDPDLVARDLALIIAHSVCSYWPRKVIMSRYLPKALNDPEVVGADQR